MFRYRLRTLLLLTMLGPSVLAWLGWPVCRSLWREYRIWRAWEEGRSYPAAIQYIDLSN